jgi:predicted alpha/beta hydrolase family esterase
LADEAQKIGYQVTAPAFPSPNLPQCAEWLESLKKAVGTPTENDYFIGHSLGPIAIMQYLRTLGKSQKIGGAIFVAGFATSLGIKETESFFTSPVDLSVLKSKTKKGYVALYSDNDPYVPVAKAEELRDNLGAKIVLVKGAGHFNTVSGYTKLEKGLEILKGWR